MLKRRRGLAISSSGDTYICQMIELSLFQVIVCRLISIKPLPIFDPNQCWLIVSWTLGKKLYQNWINKYENFLSRKCIWKWRLQIVGYFSPASIWQSFKYRLLIMMTSSNWNLFRVAGLLCGEFTGHQWIPLTKANDAELWCFLWSTPWINCWVNNREADDLRRHRVHYDVIVMYISTCVHMPMDPTGPGHQQAQCWLQRAGFFIKISLDINDFEVVKSTGNV